MQSAEASFLPPHDEQSSVVCFIPIISKNTPGGEYKGRKSFWFSQHLCKKKWRSVRPVPTGSSDLIVFILPDLH
jgi:hypothetical protein